MKKYIVIMLFVITNLIYADQFKYRDFEYFTYTVGDDRFLDRAGEINIETDVKGNSLKLYFGEDEKVDFIKFNEKKWQDILELTGIYLSFTNMAERDGIKLDKNIGIISNIIVGKKNKDQEVTYKTDINCYVFSSDSDNHYFVLQIIDKNGKKNKMYFNKMQVIELQNSFSKDSIAASVNDYGNSKMFESGN